MPNLSLMSDEEIIKTIAQAYEENRLTQQLSEEDVCTRGGVTKDAIHRFKNGKNINLKNFIGILRGIDQIDALAQLFPTQGSYSPVPHKKKALKKRIHKPKKQTTRDIAFVWGEDR